MTLGCGKLTFKINHWDDGGGVCVVVVMNVMVMMIVMVAMNVLVTMMVVMVTLMEMMVFINQWK